MYAIVENNQIVEWPVFDLRARFPNISFPAIIKPEDLPQTVAIVEDAPLPAYNPQTQQLNTLPPQLVAGVWTVQREVVSLPEPLVQQNQQMLQQQLQQEIITKTQQRLDQFAKTRNYDGILSACTYATSQVPKFQQEGQYCVNLRDQTWSQLYTLLQEVHQGTRSAPTSFEDVEPLLPPAQWPDQGA